MSPPIEFGATWRCVGEQRRYGNVMPLWLCDEPTGAFTDAYKRARGMLTGAGFSWTDRGHDQTHLVPCWWDTGIPFDAAALRAEVERVVAEAAAEREERARQDQERHQRDVAAAEISAPPIRSALRTLLDERPWALGRSLTEGRDLAAMETWTRWGLRAAERCLSNAEGNVRRAEERLGRPAPARFFALAWDEAIRASALEACRYISGLDADWAAERNARGWSQATCWTGHILSERQALNRGEAAHALALLHQHRRQLSHDACIVLFNEAPTRRRRADPEQTALGF